MGRRRRRRRRPASPAAGTYDEQRLLDFRCECSASAARSPHASSNSSWRVSRISSDHRHLPTDRTSRSRTIAGADGSATGLWWRLACAQRATALLVQSRMQRHPAPGHRTIQHRESLHLRLSHRHSSMPARNSKRHQAPGAASSSTRMCSVVGRSTSVAMRCSIDVRVLPRLRAARSGSRDDTRGRGCGIRCRRGRGPHAGTAIRSCSGAAAADEADGFGRSSALLQRVRRASVHRWRSPGCRPGVACRWLVQ